MRRIQWYHWLGLVCSVGFKRYECDKRGGRDIRGDDVYPLPRRAWREWYEYAYVVFSVKSMLLKTKMPMMTTCSVVVVLAAWQLGAPTPPNAPIAAGQEASYRAHILRAPLNICSCLFTCCWSVSDFAAHLIRLRVRARSILPGSSSP